MARAARHLATRRNSYKSAIYENAFSDVSGDGNGKCLGNATSNFTCGAIMKPNDEWIDGLELANEWNIAHKSIAHHVSRAILPH